MKTNQISLMGVATFLFVLLFPFATSRHLFSATVNLKYFWVLFFTATLSLISAVVFLRQPAVFSCCHRWLLLLFSLLLFVHYVSMFAGVFPAISFWSDLLRSSGVLFLTTLAVLVFLWSELLTERDWTLIKRSVAISGALFSAFTVLGVEGSGLSGRIWTVNLDVSGLTLGNSTFAGAYLLLSVIVTLIELTRSESGSKWRKFLIGLAIIQFISPLLVNVGSLGFGTARASSATAVLLLIYLLGRFLIKKFFPPISTKIWSGVFAVGVLAATALLFTPGSFVQEQYIQESSAARVVVWEEGFRAFQEKPIFGWGPENFRQAHERYFDNRLYQDEYLGEIWFDRAHNALVDTLVSVGLVGLTVWLGLAVVFMWVIVRARRAGIIGEWEAVLLSSIPLAHFLQLQTAFDTVGTYVLGTLILGYGLWLERQILESNKNTPITTRKSFVGKFVVAPVLVFFAVVYFYTGVVEYGRQKSLFQLFIIQDQKQQLVLADKALSRPNFEVLRLSSASMIKGLLEQMAEGKTSPNFNQNALEQLSAYEKHFKSYLSRYSDDYRVRMNYAHLLLIKTILGEDRLADAKELLKDSYRLSPQNPLTYALEALAELYGGRIKEAKVKIGEGIALNPEIEFSQQVLAHIEKQEKEFPVISVMKLENL